MTTVLEMPNTKPPTATVEALRQKQAIARAQAYVDYGIYGLLDENNLGELEALMDAGVSSFKCFMGNTFGDLPAPSDGAMLEGFEILARRGYRCTVHAENASIMARRQAKLEAAGRTDPLAHLAARPEVCAMEAVGRAIIFAEWTGARLHIAHKSSKDALYLIRDAKRRGVDVTVETCPQYLLLSTEDMKVQGGVMRVNPPIREPGHQEPLWEALREGVVDMIATDHAPHTPEEKTRASVWQCDCGFPGVETQMPLMLTEVNRGRMTIMDYVRWACANPARAWGLYPTKGVIQPGADADVVLVDLGRRARHRPGLALLQEQDLAVARSPREGAASADDGPRQGRDARRQAGRRSRLGQAGPPVDAAAATAERRQDHRRHHRPGRRRARVRRHPRTAAEAGVTDRRALAERLFGILRDLVAIPSPFPPGDTAAIAAFAADFLTPFGYRVERHSRTPGIVNVVARLGTGRPSVVLNAHADTVGVGAQAAWTTEPLAAALRDGRVYGLGACNCKSSMAVHLWLAAEIARRGGPKAGEVVFTFVGDEENLGPDGLAFLRDAGAVKPTILIVAAQTRNRLVTEERGVMWVRVTARGKAAHAGAPDTGDSAILRMHRIITAVERELAPGCATGGRRAGSSRRSASAASAAARTPTSSPTGARSRSTAASCPRKTSTARSPSSAGSSRRRMSRRTRSSSSSSPARPASAHRTMVPASVPSATPSSSSPAANPNG